VINPDNNIIKVSIIITCYNLEKFIEDAIESLLGQKVDFRYEIIIIDDASTDNSRKVLADFTDERVKCFFLEENVGAARAINIAFGHASGEYVCRFDGDDKWYPDYLQKTSDVLDRVPDIQLVHTDISFIDENNNVTSIRNNIARPVSLKEADHEFKSILEKYYMNAPAIMARRSAWDRVLPWPDRFRTGLGDWYCSLLMLENKASAFIDEPLAYYRIHTTNMHRAMIRDGSAEINTRWILDFFKNRPNAVTKGEWKKIYYLQNKQLGFSYFAHGMDKETRRCLSMAIRYNPAALFEGQVIRIWLASVMGKEFYNKIKTYLSSKDK
jgi:glycosyltransferase involved in cell wall biosynthesis